MKYLRYSAENEKINNNKKQENKKTDNVRNVMNIML